MDTEALINATEEGRWDAASEMVQTDSDKTLLGYLVWSKLPTKQRRRSGMFHNGRSSAAFDLKCPACRKRVAWVSLMANGSLVYGAGPFRRFNMDKPKDRTPLSRVVDSQKGSPTEGQDLGSEPSGGRVTIEHKCKNRSKRRTDVLTDDAAKQLLLWAFNHRKDHAYLP